MCLSLKNFQLIKKNILVFDVWSGGQIWKKNGELNRTPFFDSLIVEG